MSDARLNYLGPGPAALLTGPSGKPRKIPFGFLAVVVLPTVVAAFYFLLIASPRYVSEAQFVVRSPAQSQPSTLGAALQNVGLSGSSSEAFAVHQYMTSKDGLRDLSRRVDVRAAYSRPGVDMFSRLPHPFQGASFEAFYKAFNGYVTVGHESSTGISTLRVEAFTPEDAQRINDAMLQGGEELINRLNIRSSRDAVSEAQTTLIEAQQRLDRAQAQLTAFRNRERLIDPASSADNAGKVISALSITLATLRAERAQIASEAPNSPQLPSIDGRVRALQQQIDAAQARIVGDPDSLAPKLAAYEDLALEREFSDKLVASATASLNTAQLEARRQRLYLDRIVNPDRPDEAVEPKRLLSILAVLTTMLLVYAIGVLVLAGVRESRHD